MKIALKQTTEQCHNAHEHHTHIYTVHILAYQCEMHLSLRYFMFFILMLSAEVQMTDWVWLTVIEND